jgi:hypothetical protein
MTTLGSIPVSSFLDFLDLLNLRLYLFKSGSMHTVFELAPLSNKIILLI